MTKVDADGVPCMVQELRYFNDDMTFNGRFFNGKAFSFVAEDVSDHIGLMDLVLTQEQMIDADNVISEMALANWSKWYP